MEELEVGEYIRTKNKGIFKVCSLRKTPYGYLCGTTDNENISHFTIGKGGHSEIKNDIAKHSKNIIDLIQNDDVIEFREYDTIAIMAFSVFYEEEFEEFIKKVENNEIEIISVLTKEQFENNCYKERKEI